MENHQIVYAVCVFISIVGTLVTAIYGQGAQSVESLSPELVGRSVALHGIVNAKSVRDGHVFLEVNGYKAVVFESVAKRLQTPYLLLEGDEVELVGTVQDYQGSIELVVRGVTPC